MKLYLDTNIWIDYLDKKRIMHKQAFNLFEKITEKKHLVLISKIHMHELGKYGLFKEFNEIKNNLYKKGFCKGIKYTEEDYQIALKHNEFLKLGFNDCLHVLIAKNNKAKPISSDKHWKAIANSYGTRSCNYEDLSNLQLL